MAETLAADIDHEINLGMETYMTWEQDRMLWGIETMEAILDWTIPNFLDLNEKYTSVLFKPMLLGGFSIIVLTNILLQSANPPSFLMVFKWLFFATPRGI